MYEECLFFNLNSFVRSLNRIWEAEFARLGLSAAHGYLLRFVISKPGSTQKSLAEEMDLSPSTITRFLETLEQKGFVKRACCPEDGRAVTVKATKKGCALSKDLENVSARLADYTSATLGDQKATELVRILKQAQRLIGESRCSLVK